MSDVSLAFIAVGGALLGSFITGSVTLLDRRRMERAAAERQRMELDDQRRARFHDQRSEAYASLSALLTTRLEMLMTRGTARAASDESEEQNSRDLANAVGHVNLVAGSPILAQAAVDAAYQLGTTWATRTNMADPDFDEQMAPAHKACSRFRALARRDLLGEPITDE
jgi:hypothetical protein